MCIKAILFTLAAWFVGLVLDANIDFDPQGFLCLRILFPILVMGSVVLLSNKGSGKKQEPEEKDQEEN
jgi:hypothetical protein